MIEQTKITNTAKLEDILFDRMPKPLKFENELWEAADNLRASERLDILVRRYVSMPI